MSQSPHIVNVTQASFQQEVVERSHQVPVLVDFWASWCQPCQVLLPILTALAEEYAGGFVLAKVDTETEQGLAMEHGIRSIPTLKLFRNGQAVEEVMGAQSEEVFRQLIDQYRDQSVDPVMEQAQALWDAGQSDEALAMMNKAWLDDRGNHQLAVTLALWLSDLKRFEEANAVADAIPDDAANIDVAGLRASLRFSASTQDLPSIEEMQAALESDSKDHASRHQMAMALIAAGKVEDGLKNLLTILSQDASWDEGRARKTLLDVFEVLGAGDPLVGKYRRAMFAAIH